MSYTLPKLKVGDMVEATAKIWRFDRRSELLPGERAKVSSVFRVDENTQIIGLEIEGKLPMGGIVCNENTPVRKV